MNNQAIHSQEVNQQVGNGSTAFRQVTFRESLFYIHAKLLMPTDI